MSKIVQAIELRQKRCSLRFGVGTCEAAGTPKCFQTYETCKFRSAFNLSGQLSWYFHRQGDPVPRTAALPNANLVYPPSIPILRTVRTEPTRINLGAVRENESPFGLRGTISVTLNDFEFRNQFGDFYADERTVQGSLGRLLLAWIGEAVPQLELYLYTGTDADASLADMTIRRYDVTNISPPSGGSWTISAIDPLARAERKKAQFPPATDLRLQSDIDATTTSISVAGLETDVSKVMGNDGFFYGRLGSEIVRYTAYTGSAGIWALSGVVRGVLGTIADEHSVDDGLQRVGHYERILYWQMVYDLLTNHTTIPSSLIPYATDWTSEGESWLSTLAGTGTFTEPRAVSEICAEAMRDGMFSIWWDEREQEIKMLALRQPVQPPKTFTERNAIVTSALKRTPDDRRTRVTIYYDRRDPTESLTETRNYRQQRIRIDAEAEGANFADGTVRNLIWYSPLLRTDLNAVLVQASFLQRYRTTPRYLDLQLAEKDASISVGDVIYVESHDILDSLGYATTEPWQVIEWEEVEPGFSYRVLVQSFILYERPAFIMANDAPNFSDATDAQKLNACYISENDGTMPDGSVGYVIQ
tara:strand:- start:566 stop:2326 length:1761 start_codon:yes stop_codon:yes gene_type:complete